MAYFFDYQFFFKFKISKLHKNYTFLSMKTFVEHIERKIFYKYVKNSERTMSNYRDYLKKPKTAKTFLT